MKEELTISFDQHLSLLHLLEQVSVANDAGSISYFATAFVQARDDTHDGSFLHVCECGYPLERLQNRHVNTREPDTNKGQPTIPFAHSYTTSIKPNLVSLNSGLEML